MNNILKGWQKSSDNKIKSRTCINRKGADSWIHTHIFLSSFINIDSNFKYAYDNKGKLLEKLGKYTEAIECFDKFIKIDSTYKFAYDSIGKLLEKLGKYSEAIEWCNKAKQIKDNNEQP